jgi:protein-disulfide isomerase
MDEQKSSPLQSFTPKQIFLFGAAGGVLVLCTIGFFVLLGVVLKGGAGSNGSGTGLVPSAAAPTNTDGNGNGAAAISIRPVDAKDHIRGDKNAAVTIVEYSDFECPFCKSFHNTMRQVLDANSGKVRWVFRHFPLESLHSQARKEALASECAAEQGKFWEFADLIFQETTSNDTLDLTKLPDYARRINLDVNQFNVCMNTEKYMSVVNADLQDAQSAGARGTPHSILVGPKGQLVPLSGALPVSQVQQAIDALLSQ